MLSGNKNHDYNAREIEFTKKTNKYAQLRSPKCDTSCSSLQVHSGTPDYMSISYEYQLKWCDDITKKYF